MRLFLLVVLIATLRVLPAFAQQLPAEGFANDSTPRAGRAAGIEAAQRGDTAGPFVISFVGGVPLGLFGPVAILLPAPPFIVAAVAGGAITVGAHSASSHSSPSVPPQLEAQLGTSSEEYQQAFRLAYARELARRRARATLWGGAVGTGVGMMLLGWAAYNFSHSDF